MTPPTIGRIHGLTHVGRIRSRNEDAWGSDEETGLAVVADGMGGHPAGDVASRIAVDTILAAGREKTDGTGEEWLPEAVLEAHRRILAEAEENPERRGMGTTLTALHLDPAARRWRVGHVGDSRGYLFRDGELVPLTRDDTPVQEQVDAGLLTGEQARLHPHGHVLSQALGGAVEVEPRSWDGELRPGDVFLLCTDGVMAVLPDPGIEEVLSRWIGEEETNLRDAAEDLVEDVLSNGAPDNVTVVLVGVE